MALDIESSNPLRSFERLSRPCAVKKLMALSRAELTRLPVARRVWVCVIRSDVCCSCSRFDRTPADRTIEDILGTFLVYLPYWQLHTCRSIGSQNSSHNPPNGP